MWQRGGDIYTQLMGRWSRLLSPLLIDFAEIEDGDRVLDIGCGTGSLTRALLEHGPNVQVAGIDASGPYVEFARQQIASPRASLEQGDAQSLSFADDFFDKCVSLLVLNFVPDAGKAVREMRRVTRRQGKITAGVWDYGDGMEMLRILWDTAVELDPAAKEKHERNMPLCREGELGELWAQIGLRGIDQTPLTIHLDFESFDDYWTPFLTGAGPSGSYVSSLDDDLRGELRERLLQRLCDGNPDQSFQLTARAWAVRGNN